MKNSWEKQQDGVIFKKIGIWDTLTSHSIFYLALVYKLFNLNHSRLVFTF